MSEKNPFARATARDEKKAEAILQRGRKAAQTTPVIEPDIDQPRIDNALTVMRADAQAVTLAENQHEARVRAVAAQVGYQLPSDCADPDLIQRDIAVNMRRTAEAMLQVGLGLICLKEACQHGEFTARLEVLRFEPRVAQQYMKVARKLANTNTSSHLLKAIDSQSKLLELIVLDDEQLEELALTGETGELKLDKIASMTTRELRAQVRELLAEKEASEKLLAIKNEKLDEAALLKKSPPDARIAALLVEAQKAALAAVNDISGDLRKALAGIEEISQEAGATIDFRPLASGLLGQLQQAITVVRDEFMIEDIIGDGVPEWVRATSHLQDGED